MIMIVSDVHRAGGAVSEAREGGKLAALFGLPAVKHSATSNFALDHIVRKEIWFTKS